MAYTTFYRPVRSYPDPLPSEVIKIEPPPAQQQKQGGSSSLVQFLYPLSGLLMSGIFILTTVSGGRGAINPWLLGAEVSIMPLSVGLMLLANFLQRRSFTLRAKADQAKYKEYLDGQERRISEIAKMQQERNTRLYPDLPQLVEVVKRQRFLWERRPADADFLMVRVGQAPAPLCCSIEFQEDYRVDYDLALLQRVRNLTTQKSHIDQQPFAISLPQLGTLAIAGQHEVTRALTRAMLCQIVTFHSPNEVRVVGYFSPQAAPYWSWLKWLPHTRSLRQTSATSNDASEQLCMLAETVEDFEDILLTQIKPEVERRTKLNQDTRASVSREQQKIPHLVVLLDSFSPRDPLAYAAGLEEILYNSTQLGITVLCLVEEGRQEPSMIQGRLLVSTIAGDPQLRYTETRLGGTNVEFVLPMVADVPTCEYIARLLSPLTLVDMDTELDFSQDVRLLALQNVPSVDKLQVAELWRRATDRQLLSVPIGQQKNGPLFLDLKEMAAGGFGPHGLVVGATGSGKSELLRTVVASLAMTHDPYTINFVLVDFKAGAAFADFEHLPHVAGIITNLENDPLLISRMYTSLLGEQNRRQTMLSNAGNLSNIRQYQAKWRKNPSMEPMPYLLIIVDEFAQLIANHEEFLGLFTKFGQVGRSLGMHMMLATQRIDEGRIKSLDGHLRYRICLRTFRPEESSAVIGTPDAYYLPPSAGSGYFKVDEDIYMPFKAALISTPYVPPERQQVDPVTLIREFTHTGKLVPLFSPPKVPTANLGEEPGTEMDMVVKRILQTPPPAQGWRVHPVWQPPLREHIPLDEVLERVGYQSLDGTCWYSPAPFGQLIIPVGMLDRPAEQMQEPVLLDFSGVGGHLVIVGAPQSGKSTLLRTIITSFMITHSPKDVQLYCIDLGGGLLRVFDGAPHIGAVCGKAERDKIRRVIRRMRQIIIERETLFSGRGIDSMATYRRMRQDGTLKDEEFGDVFLILDNLSQFQNDFEPTDPELIVDLTTIIANGLTYGVHVIIAANQWMEVRPRLRSNIGARLELRLNDPIESEIDRKQAVSIPVDTPGRGLQQSKLLFQTALPVVRSANTKDGMTIQQILEAMVQRTCNAWKGPIAPQILVLPPEVCWETPPPPGAGQSGVPIGVDEFHLSPMYIDLNQSDPHFLTLGDRECGKTTLIRTWIRGIEHLYTPEQVKFILIDYRKTSLDLARSKHAHAYIFTPDKVKECVKQLKAELEKRLEESLSMPIEQLHTPRPWAGLHYIIFVDDYETMATPDPRSSNPLNPLEGLLQSAREIGFHIVLARRVANLGQTMMDPIFRGIKNMESPGLLMRGDPTEGRQALHKQSVSDSLPPGRGYLVRRGYPPTSVQIAKL